jgi:hypothetical protein
MAINQALSTSSAHTTSLLRMPPSQALLGLVLITTALFFSRRRVPNLQVWHFVSWRQLSQTLTRIATFGLTPLTGSRSCITSGVLSFDGLGHWLVQFSAQFATRLRTRTLALPPRKRVGVQDCLGPSFGSRSFSGTSPYSC